MLTIISKDILKRFSHLLPDLHNIIIFLPSNFALAPLRKKLTRHVTEYGHEALVLPTCTTLRQWVLENHSPDKPLLSQYARELILVDAIKRQPGMFAYANPWVIASELLSFFDAMRLNDVSSENFQGHLSSHESATNVSRVFSQEADLVTTLWSAWQQQLLHEDLLDPIEAYVQAIRKMVLPEREFYYAAGLDKFSEYELSLLEKIEDQSRLQTFIYGSNLELSSRTDHAVKALVTPHANTDLCLIEETSLYSRFLDEVFIDNNVNIKQRAENFSNAHPISPATPHLKIYKGNSFEHHVKAIDIKIRSCLHENKENIGIVTADRKLARRLRAVLEHANVSVNDWGGWALETTSAAVVVESWLQLVEGNYPAKQLLTLLKSPFFPVSITKETHDDAINFFEKNIVLASNLHNGLSRYRAAIEQLRARRDTEDMQALEYLCNLLDRLDTTTRALVKLRQSESVPLHRFFKELVNGLKISGLYTTLVKDDAGRQIINLFESQIAHFQKIENAMNWSEWRRFSARILDQQNYKPPLFTSGVTLCNLEQSRLLKFDALIIASVDKSHFPGNPDNYIFFNEHIRSELNIPTWLDEHAVYFHLFRRLLDAAPDILITVQNEQNGEKNTSSPWLDAIETFHAMAYGSDLLDKELQSLVMRSDVNIVRAQYVPMPLPSLQPSPVLASSLKPKSISTSQYQMLVDCPYQFFAHACLGLSKTDELAEELGKDKFGSLVHKCIHAFFVNEPSTPGPFTEKVTIGTREAAEDMLALISKHIFNQYDEHGFSSQLWLHRWLTLIPDFINWEIQRQKDYSPYRHEFSSSENISPATSIRGRIDRVDQSAQGYAIIDYKTGQTPSKKSITAGEQVQLPAYALLHENCNRVEYVSIGKKDTIKPQALFEKDQLEGLVKKHRTRLSEFFSALDNGAHFTALAEDNTCDWCEVRGLCRKDYWQS